MASNALKYERRRRRRRAPAHHWAFVSNGFRLNLILNGIDAMKNVDGRRGLAIESNRAGNEELTVCVSDTGVGVPPEQTDQIFNAFLHDEASWDRHRIFVNRSIIESHDGRLWTDNNSPRGASFHLILYSPKVAACD